MCTYITNGPFSTAERVVNKENEVQDMQLPKVPKKLSKGVDQNQAAVANANSFSKLGVPRPVTA